MCSEERILLVQHVFRGKNSAGAACIQRKEFCWCSMYSAERILLAPHLQQPVFSGKISACTVSVPTRTHVSAKHPKYEVTRVCMPLVQCDDL
ncbi:hypothetical protein AVEN_269797-1 [Araneus ventricosus]|uniref:Uncharacterized protein n=1 Tax=Araneus ventricosus TaxID=182803 RepID=A0A4Y2RF22_ARAVE|nr:hypothetical protein AVEN_269797-1 [Araneus ventricosus]